eukprot:m.26108 g.26108  ORF g.26108 m.26108 type:complete len:162 (+) comp29125_c0_seq1:332-817(+)
MYSYCYYAPNADCQVLTATGGSKEGRTVKKVYCSNGCANHARLRVKGYIPCRKILRYVLKICLTCKRNGYCRYSFPCNAMRDDCMERTAMQFPLSAMHGPKPCITVVPIRNLGAPRPNVKSTYVLLTVSVNSQQKDQSCDRTKATHGSQWLDSVLLLLADE